MKAPTKTTKRRKSRADDDVKVEPSSGNVFADLGFPNPEEHLLKAELMIRIEQLIEKNGWTQAQAAERMNLDQPKVSRILR